MNRTRSTALLVGARFVGQLVGLFAIPVIVGVLGTAGFGFCGYLIALGPFVSMIDIGICEGLNRMLISRIGSGTMDEAISIHRTLDRFLLAYSAAQMLIFMIIGWAQGYSPWLFALAGFALSAKSWLNYTNSWHAGHKQFQHVAASNLINNFAANILSLIFVLIWRTPAAYFVGMAAGALLGTGYIRLRVRDEAKHDDPAAFAHIKEAFLFGRRFVWNKLSNALGGGADRLAIKGIIGPSALGQYNLACRFPESGSEVLPLSAIVGPEMIQSNDKGKEHFAESTNHTMRIALLACLAIIAIPCSFGATILPLWLHGRFAAEMSLTMACIGVYQALLIFYTVNAAVILAAGRPEIVFPFTLYNGLITLFASPFIARSYGIEGIGVMNLLIQVTQFPFLVYIALRLAMEKTEAKVLLGKLGGTFGLGMTFCVVGFWGSHFLTGWQAWLFPVVIPAWVTLFGFLVVRLGLSPTPYIVTKAAGAIRKRLARA